MTAFSIRVAAASLDRACGRRLHDDRRRHRAGRPNGNIGATFTWTETGGTRGTMVAQLSNGQVFQGPLFQITSGKPGDGLRPAVERLGTRLRLGPRLGRPAPGAGAGAAGVRGARSMRPSPIIAARCSPTCRARAASCAATSRLMSPSSGMAGGGVGQCQLPDGNDHPRPVPAAPRLLRAGAESGLRSRPAVVAHRGAWRRS